MEHTIKRTKLIYHGQRILAHNYKSADGATHEQIRRKFNGIVSALYNAGNRGNVQLAVVFPGKDGKPGKWRNVTKYLEIRPDTYYPILNEEELDYWGNNVDMGGLPERFHEFDIKVAPLNLPGGNSDEDNECLYNCLMTMIPEVMKRAYPTPETLRTWCKVKKDDIIPLSKLPKIEERLGDYKINVQGEHIYTSTKKAKHTITLKLNREHYEIAKQKHNFVRGVSTYERIPVIYEILPKRRDYVRVYDGIKTGYMKFQRFRDHQKKAAYDPYVFIKCKGGDLKECFDTFIEDADILKEKTNGKYNLYKCGTVAKAAMSRFCELNKTLMAEPILQDEAEWLNDCNMGGLCWSEKGYTGNAWKWDVNSAFPTVLSDQKFSFPIKRGTFKKITQKEFQNMTYYEPGIYRVTISDPDYKLLPTRKPNFIHYDLTLAKKLGYKMEIIQDDKPNVLLYGGETRINGSVAFREYVTELYELKKKYGKQYPVFKQLITFIWGVLCERNRMKKYVANDGDDYEIPDTEKLLDTTTCHKGELVVTSPINEQFYTNFARLGPFLLSRQRCMMANIIQPHLKYIKRVYVDGIIACKQITWEKTNTKTIDSVKVGTDLGDLKYEGYNDHISIGHNGRVEGLKKFLV